MTRLYTPQSLRPESSVTLSDDQSHYLRHVLRFSVGDKLSLFNENDGEFQATVSLCSKSKTEITVNNQTRPIKPEPSLSVVFCPIKNDAQHYLIEKCTEIGVSEFQPVIMQHGNIHKINREKLQKIAIEAAQQCERMTIPIIHPLKKIDQILSNWDKNKKIFACIERQETVQILNTIDASAILIGPEGGFHPDEISLLTRQDFVIPISLGQNILRAETAAIVASALILIR